MEFMRLHRQSPFQGLGEQAHALIVGIIASGLIIHWTNNDISENPTSSFFLLKIVMNSFLLSSLKYLAVDKGQSKVAPCSQKCG